MADKIQTLKALQNRPSGQWDAAISLLAQEHPMAAIENLVSVDDIVKHFHMQPQLTPGNPQRNLELELFGRYKNLIHVCCDLELMDGRLCVPGPFHQRTSWSHWLFSRFSRAPNTNVNVRHR